MGRLTAPRICAKYRLVILMHSNQDSNATLTVYDATVKLITSSTTRPVCEMKLPIPCIYDKNKVARGDH